MRLAEKIGAIAVDDALGDPVEQVLDLTGGEGADKGCECVGWQAHDPHGHAYRHFDDREDGWTKVVLHPTHG
ncbi:hypothetical protein FRAAL4127 [Frankia alni ACN14a]|uniref:Uncharacterized protein n=1 Tax=Frankia alni (strain DSM 45986 / CECT 9034 / ACN14a) TaxID=326424 RepID=Q0RIA2_FRAAA|nr:MULTISPECIES: hypothetical protein [Frankia]CAJ62769.1 hypothetical protein FRAAL4127 [Frankia alni ACN14a]